MKALWGAMLCVAAAACETPLEYVPNSPSAADVGEEGWVLSGAGSSAYRVRRDGSAWLLEPTAVDGRYGTWMRHIDAAPYRGKHVTITASVKTAGCTKRVDFWTRAQAGDSPADGAGLGDDSTDLPADGDFGVHTLALDVDARAAWLEYGVGIGGPGRLWTTVPTVEVSP